LGDKGQRSKLGRLLLLNEHKSGHGYSLKSIEVKEPHGCREGPFMRKEEAGGAVIKKIKKNPTVPPLSSNCGKKVFLRERRKSQACA